MAAGGARGDRHPLAESAGPGVLPRCDSANDGFLKDLPADLMAEPTIPPGHPEAFHDAFARLHRCFEQDVRTYLAGKPLESDGTKYANVLDGRTGIAFIDAAVASSQKGGAWVDVA